MLDVCIGYDKREHDAFEVCAFSLKRRTNERINIIPLIRDNLEKNGLYKRETCLKDNKLYDVISEAYMATDFAITRFLSLHITTSDWVLFMDCDMLIAHDIKDLIKLLDNKYAVMCVKHEQTGLDSIKMDDQVQSFYKRKNWSSFMLFNRNHPSNKKLTLDLINSKPGRDLHAFCWLNDDEIGSLPLEWNWLEGYNNDMYPIYNIHYTRGGPWFSNYNDVQYADIWLREKQLLVEKQNDFNC